jgi:hypothetical protein
MFHLDRLVYRNHLLMFSQMRIATVIRIETESDMDDVKTIET